MRIERIVFLIVLLCLCAGLHAKESKLDSLKKEFSKALQDSVRVRLMITIGVQFEKINIDSTLTWYNKVLTLVNSKKKYDDGIAVYHANALQLIGRIECLNKSNYDKSYEITSQSIKEYEEVITRSKKDEVIKKAKTGISGCNNILANINISLGNYDKALEFCIAALKISEEIGDRKGMSSNYGSIGIIHKTQGNYDKALEYYFKALKIEEGRKDGKGAAAIYVNIGNIYGLQGNISSNPKVKTECHEKALSNYFKSLKIFEELKNKYGMSKCYGNIGIIYGEQGRFDKSLEYYLMSLKICEELGDKNGIAGVYDNIATLHLRFADSTLLSLPEKRNHLKQAVEYSEKSFWLADKIGSLSWKNSSSGTLMRAYNQLGNIKEAFKYAQVLIETRDSMFKEEKTNALANAEKKYHSEKKQKEIELLNKDKELQKIEIKWQIIQKYVFIIGFALMLVIAFLALFSYRKIRGQKKLILEKNEELNQQNEEIRAQRDEIEMQRNEITTQRDTVTNQKEKLEEIHFQLTDSIRYAERIQKAVLPSEQYIKEKINAELFIFFQPKDIVSGDFYFIEQRKNWIILAVADCTGHGVPGAFMSMLGISFLNEIIAKEEITLAAHVLDKLREYIIKSLQQKGISGEQKDGMDVGFCAINTETLEMQFAGANNPCWIITQSGNKEIIPLDNVKNYSTESENQFPQLIELKGDKMPIGIHENMIQFTSHEIKLCKGDLIFLATDGFEDQFGGNSDKKFLSKNLKQLLSDNSDKSMNEQKEILHITFNEWKGNRVQTDDITVLGIRI